MKEKNPLRELARSNYWQYMYKASKDNNIKLFDNDRDLSAIQIRLLSYIAIYESIYTDIATGDCGLMDYERIKDDMLVDAYLVAKRKNRNKDKNKNNRRPGFNGIPSIDFVTPVRKRR